MALIEKYEIQELKKAIVNPFTYITFAVLCSPFYFINIEQNVLLMALLAYVFSLIVVIDIKEYIIPDTTQLLIFLIACGLVYTSYDQNYMSSFIGLCFAGGMFGGIYYVYENILKRSAMGFGDVKLFGNVGFLLGVFSFNYFLWILTLTSGIFVIFRLFLKKKNKLIPYGPFIVVSAWICLVFNEYLESAYIDLMNKIFN